MFATFRGGMISLLYYLLIKDDTSNTLFPKNGAKSVHCLLYLFLIIIQFYKTLQLASIQYMPTGWVNDPDCEP